MRIFVPSTTLEHKRAMNEIEDVFLATRDRMNGRHLRSVLMAYLRARGLGDLPVRVRIRTEKNFGLQKYFLCVEYPDPHEAPDYERNYVEIPEGFGDDLHALVHEWFERNQHRLSVRAWNYWRGSSWGEDVRPHDYRVVSDPWFANRV